uniref:Uncharacterized protein n=1 Tax=Knipowitschia caucasica TaxID=637954 RepID=A0AAV2LYM4_KNICA
MPEYLPRVTDIESHHNFKDDLNFKYVSFVLVTGWSPCNEGKVEEEAHAQAEAQTKKDETAIQVDSWCLHFIMNWTDWLVRPRQGR